MSLSEEEECHACECFDHDEELKMKKRQIVEAVEENDIDLLKTLLDAPKRYKVRDQNKSPLLHIAILQNNKEVFDYLLSLPDYPLEVVDSNGNTALQRSLTHFIIALDEDEEDIRIIDNIKEYYASELIDRGANVQVAVGTLLHNALEINLIEVAKLLIKKGVDVNKKDLIGNTPLHIFCTYYREDNLVEGVSMLLYHGADPMIPDTRGFTLIDLILLHPDCDISMAENILFNNIFNQYEYDMNVETFLKAIDVLDSLISYELVKNTRKVIFNNNLPSDYTSKLFTMKTNFLKLIIEKFDYVVTELLSSEVTFISSLWTNPIQIENFYVLLKSKLELEFTAWLCTVDLRRIIWNLVHFKKYDLSSIQELICLLLSYGMRVFERELETVYREFGYSELFKILLHMDVEKQLSLPMTDIIPYILYNVTLDIPKMLLDRSLLPAQFSIKDFEELVPYYTIPFNLLNDGLENVQIQPRVPLLVELARNVFRRYFIERLSIRNAKQFYTFVKLLPISNYHKQIITLEAKLY